MKKVLSGAAAALAMIGAAHTASAADYRGEFGVVGGLVKQSENLTQLDQEIGDSTPWLGLRFGRLLSDRVGWFGEGRHAWIRTARPQMHTGTFDFRSGVELYGPEPWDGAPLYVAGAGGLELISFDTGESVDRPIVSGGLGQRIRLADDLLGRWEARVTHAFEDRSDIVADEMTHYEFLLGLSLTWGGSDSDGDGVRDSRDACPNTPYGARVDARGCPSDPDGDGVWEGLDQCPDTPRGATVNSRGCPSDSDGDGVYDGLDACPDTPGGATVDARGCSSDADGDGVADGIDRCPDTPAGTAVDVKGCPVLFEAERDDLVLEGVNFETNSAVLLAGSRTVLDRVAQSLRAWPDVQVEVGGHTDSRGDAAYNLKLSGERAESVRRYLVGRGVSERQLTATGYGETQPVADNETAEGRALNRRVELRRK